MYFKTLRKSKTGEKISKIEEKSKKAHDETLKLSKELGFYKWRIGYWCAFGGVSCVMFDKKPNTKFWKKQEDGFFPKINSKAGKDLTQKFNDLPSVSYEDLNQSVGFGGGPWKHIGVNFNSEEYFGFVIGDDWDYKIPSDCKEITKTEYDKLFK